MLHAYISDNFRFTLYLKIHYIRARYTDFDFHRIAVIARGSPECHFNFLNKFGFNTAAEEVAPSASALGYIQLSKKLAI